MTDNTFPQHDKEDIPCIEASCPVCESFFIYDLDNPPEDYETFCMACGCNRDMIILRVS